LDRRYYAALEYQTSTKAWVGFADLRADLRSFANPLVIIRNDSFFVVKEHPFSGPKKGYDLELV